MGRGFWQAEDGWRCGDHETLGYVQAPWPKCFDCDFEDAMRAMVRFMTWVEMEAVARRFNKPKRHRYHLLRRSIELGKLRLGWGDEIGGEE